MDIQLPPYRAITAPLSLLSATDKLNWGHTFVKASSFYNRTKGEKTAVFILDTAGQTSHPDLAPNLLEGGKYNRNFTSDPTGEDRHGHGHHCAGIACAAMNDMGIAGVAPEAKLALVKVLNYEGGGAWSWIEEAIRYVADLDIPYKKVLSMSFGSPVSSPAIYKALKYAKDKGCYLFAAAGNEGYSQGQNTVGYPAKYDNEVIAIASINTSGEPSSFSSAGGEVDFAFPGERIYSTHKDNGYAYLSGTSMATPLAAGIAALLLSDMEISDQDELEEILEKNAIDTWKPGKDERTGSGYIQMDRFQKEVSAPRWRRIDRVNYIKRNRKEDGLSRALQAHSSEVDMTLHPSGATDKHLKQMSRTITSVLKDFNVGVRVSVKDEGLFKALSKLDNGIHVQIADREEMNVYDIGKELLEELEVALNGMATVEKFSIEGIQIKGA